MTQRTARWLWGLSILLCALTVGPQGAWAQSTGVEPAQASGSVTLWQTIRSGGIIGWGIIGLSFVALALVIDHFRTIQSARIVPASTVAEAQKLIRAKQFKEVFQYCKAEDSVISRIVKAGIVNVNLGYGEVRTVMEDEGRKEFGKLRQRISYLNLIGIVSPMLGLLGTVLGMITSFNVLALSPAGVKPAALAGGISMALITTFEGLIVAIPALFFFHYFQNRISTIAAELETTCELLLRPIKLLPGGGGGSRPRTERGQVLPEPDE